MKKRIPQPLIRLEYLLIMDHRLMLVKILNCTLKMQTVQHLIS